MKAQRLVDFLEELPRNSEAPHRVDPLLGRFIECVEDACDERYRQRHGEVNLVEQLLDTFALLKRRPAGETLVQLSALKPNNGGALDNTLIEVVVTERPFVVDTIGLFLDFTGLQVMSSCFVGVGVERDEHGELQSLGDGGDHDLREIVARFEIHGLLDESFGETVLTAILQRLRTGERVVEDFHPMRDRLQVAGQRQRSLLVDTDPETNKVIEDTNELITWLLHDNFIFMGLDHQGLDTNVDVESKSTDGLGHCDLGEDERQALRLRVRRMARGERGLDQFAIAYKSQEESVVHRAGKIDNFVIKSFSDNGEHDGYLHLRGLFTFKAIQTLGGQIPLVRLKLRDLLAKAEYKPGSIPWKAYTNAFNSIPVEFLFEAQPSDIATIVETVLYVEKSRELRSHVVVDREERKGLYFLVLPRQGYSEELRTRIENVLIEGMGATYSDSRVYFGKFDTVVLSFFFTATERFKKFTTEDLDERVRSVAGTWGQRFTRILSKNIGEEAALLLQAKYQHAFPEEYQLITPPAEAALDVEQLEKLDSQERDDIAFEVVYSDRDRARRVCRLRVYLKKNVYLSRLLPVLDNFGLQVIDQSAFRILPGTGGELHVHIFRIAGIEDENSFLLAQRHLVVEALQRSFTRRMDNDTLNQLVIGVGLRWQDVNLIRAYVNYLRQLGVANTFAFMSNTFLQHPELTRRLIEYYRIRFDPALDCDLEARRVQAEVIEEEIQTALQDVPSQAQDNFIRLLLNLLKSTLRTSHFQAGTMDDHFRLSFKIDSTALVVGTDPKPWREIFVHHYETEGIHLRGGRLARGGLRWSDRISDYREEVLGLMRTQMVKNVLIVPVGAKGGFVIRRPVQEPEARRAQADEMYEIYINGLLDITDNVIDGNVVHPEGVVCHDGEDPYLVVAADKGTAHLSDTANRISLSRKFWLGDAFASGGSQGYDHKALGITARGAWESVRRHFREMGVDPEVDTVTVSGVGDMSGDVFGNGLLSSRTLALVAAFNHLHIFVDPTPDPARSFDERKRLFELPRSSWRDYEAEVLSPGGAIYDRNAKTIDLTPEAQRLLGFSEGTQRPDTVIQAILSLKVDLFWNGGIGTYVKSSKEDSRDVGDLANVSVRINAKQFRAKVFGEGGNLGMTQAGRVELAMRGCRLNTDFVDNSAGVNCSDHEVNLKILLEQEIRAGRLDVAERNGILAGLGDDVCRSVLAANYDQTLMISLDKVRSTLDLFSFERAIKSLEDRSIVSRERDRLPSLEALLSRDSKDQGLTRPELATLGAYTKMEIKRQLSEAPPDAIPSLLDGLNTYFPDSVVARFGDSLPDHLLAREIAVSVLANSVVDHAGIAFFWDGTRETGRGPAELIRAYLLVDELFQGWGMKERILAQDGQVAAELQYQAVLAVEESMRRAVAWVLTGQDKGRMARLESNLSFYTDALKHYEHELPQGLAKPERARFKRIEDVFYDGGFTVGLPERVARFVYLPAGLRIVNICHETSAPVAAVTRLYYRIGQESQIFPLVRICDDKSFIGRWESLALRIIRNTLLDSLWSLTSQVVRQLNGETGEEGEPGERWLDAGVAVARQHPQFEELRRDLRRLVAEDLTIAAIQVMSARLTQAFGV